MAGKKKEIQLQTIITNQDEWDVMLQAHGVTVIDVYQAWCGPCKAVIALFRKLKLEHGDNILHFAVAEADGVDALSMFRGRCEPVFLFCSGGEVVSVVRGVDTPLLQKSILEKVEEEKKFIEEGNVRQKGQEIIFHDEPEQMEEEEEEEAETSYLEEEDVADSRGFISHYFSAS
nr:PREDICTED: thioredoxin domain-containing protein 6-like [Latimeria chalumnae]|eukprot:XP_014352867.1 PREDICTED: thioredoxin domain-containing protein 6-like [Latimeria chalumnae]